MKQDAEVVATCHFLQQLHQEEVVVVGEVGLFKYGCQLKLVGRHLVVTRGHGNAQLVRFHFEVLHERRHALGNGTEVVVVELLTLCRGCAKQRTARHGQVGSRRIQRLVHDEVLLLPTQGGIDLGDVLVEVLTHRRGCRVHCRQRLQEGHLVVEGVSGVADEDGGDAKRFSPHKRGRSGVPQRVTTGLKRVANAAAWERRGVGFLLHEQGSIELFNGTPIGCGRDEAVVLFRRASGQGLEPVRIVRRTAADCPLLHGRRRLVCHFAADGGSLFHGLHDAVVGFVREVRTHHVKVEHVFTEVLGDFVGRTRLMVRHAIQHFVQGLLTVEAHGVEFWAKIRLPLPPKRGSRRKNIKNSSTPPPQ